MIGPNVAGHGHTHNDTYCEKAQDDTEQLLKQEEHGLRVRRGQIVFGQDSISSRTRSGAHIMWMCMSNQMKNENEVACEFEKSSLWHRRVIAGVQMKPNGEFVLPFVGVPPTSAENLAKAQMFKQHISGVDLINKFKESLWKGMQVSPKNGAVYVDVLPYDDSVLLSTVQSLSKSKPKEPQEMVITCVWARGDQEQDKRRSNADWLKDSTRRAIDRTVRGKLLIIPGHQLRDFQPLYHLTFPTADGHLAFRQKALDEWGPKFARLKQDYDKSTEKHNREFNPSGTPFKGDAQNKRAAPLEDIEAEGDPFPEECVVDAGALPLARVWMQCRAGALERVCLPSPPHPPPPPACVDAALMRLSKCASAFACVDAVLSGCT